MNDSATPPGRSTNPPDPGLCRDCRYSRAIESDRGSVFFMCELSFEDPRFAKYPRLPVLACGGYQSPQRT